jgi:hypothetical protein
MHEVVGEHVFPFLVDSTGLLERAKAWEEWTDTPWPHGLDGAWRWAAEAASGSAFDPASNGQQR